MLFLQGGASLQFAMVPLNLGSGGAYVNTGVWATKALKEARIIGEAHEIWSSAAENFGHVPGPEVALAVPEGAPYLHFTSNNTIYGTQWDHVPPADAPLVGDLSSDFMSRPVDVTPFDLIYAGAQKNAGPSGVTVIIARKTVSRRFGGDERTPKILRYATHASQDSMFNTPPTFAIYVVGLVARWVQAQGGLEGMARTNEAKARLLYEAIDRSPGFEGMARPDSRSRMNVTFTTGDKARDAAFVQRAEALDMIGLKGHRDLGGLRASIYNAVPMASVEALVDLIRSV